MPVYEYKCDECHVMCDITHPMDCDEIHKCHTCGRKMRRLISAPAFIVPVYRAEELLKKKDTPNSEREYAQKLSTSPKLK